MPWLKRIVCHIAVDLGFIDRPDLTTLAVNDHPVPGEMESGVIYVVGGPGYQKWAILRCPRHENEIIQLSLMAGRRPRWSIKTDILGRPTIYPSVRQLEGSFAHFWIKSGRVEWCADSGRAPHYASF
mgnify:CR=1 FL=1|jgi:hypothetical protein